MANLTKQTVVLIGEETTVGQSKASTADFASTEVSADLLARTEGTLATIVEDGGNLYRFLGTADELGVDLTAEDFTNTNRWADIGTPWVDADAVLVQDTSGMNMSIESLERNNLTPSLVSCKALSGTSTSSGTIDAELAVMPIQGTEAGKLNPHYVIKNAMGTYIEKGANVTAGTSVTEVATGTGTHDLYRLQKLGEDVPTLALRQYEGGDVNSVLDFGGIVFDSLAFNLSQSELLTTSASAGGTRTYINTQAQPTPPNLSCGDSNNVFVVKNILFSLDGNITQARDVSITVNNTVADRESINEEGIYQKLVTSKSIEISFSKDLENLQELIKFKQNASATLFIEMINGNGDQAVMYFPDISRTTVERADSDGVVAQNLTFMANNDANGNAIYLASKKA